MNKKQSRRSLTDLVSAFDVPELEKKKTKTKKTSTRSKQQSHPENNLLNNLKKSTAKTTRITVDLDPETYDELEKLCEYTGQPKAKLIRGLIKEATKLLQNMQ